MKVKTSPIEDNAPKVIPQLVSFLIIGFNVDCGGRKGTSERIRGVEKLVYINEGLIQRYGLTLF